MLTKTKLINHCYKLYLYLNDNKHLICVSYLPLSFLENSEIHSICKEFDNFYKKQTVNKKSIILFNEIINYYKQTAQGRKFKNYHATYLAPESFQDNSFLNKLDYIPIYSEKEHCWCKESNIHKGYNIVLKYYSKTPTKDAYPPRGSDPFITSIPTHIFIPDYLFELLDKLRKEKRIVFITLLNDVVFSHTGWTLNFYINMQIQHINSLIWEYHNLREDIELSSANNTQGLINKYNIKDSNYTNIKNNTLMDMSLNFIMDTSNDLSSYDPKIPFYYKITEIVSHLVRIIDILLQDLSNKKISSIGNLFYRFKDKKELIDNFGFSKEDFGDNMLELLSYLNNINNANKHEYRTVNDFMSTVSTNKNIFAITKLYKQNKDIIYFHQHDLNQIIIGFNNLLFTIATLQPKYKKSLSRKMESSIYY